MELQAQQHLVPVSPHSAAGSVYPACGALQSSPLPVYLVYHHVYHHFVSSFFTWDVLREYWAPPGDYAIKLFPCLFTTAYGLGSKRVVSLFFLSCCTSAWSPRSTSEYLAFLCMPEYALPLLF